MDPVRDSRSKPSKTRSGDFTNSVTEISNGVNVILASASARRQKLLKKIIPHFRILHPLVSEKSLPAKGISPYKYVQNMARAKAESVLDRARTDALIIAADTIVWTDREIIGKPHSRENAFRILKMLSGTQHSVITGVCVLDTSTNRVRTGYEKTVLRMQKLSDAQIRRIVSQRKHLDKAGGYAIQEARLTARQTGDKYIKIIRGRLDNAVGLPLNLVRQFMPLKTITHHCRYDIWRKKKLK